MLLSDGFVHSSSTHLIIKTNGNLSEVDLWHLVIQSKVVINPHYSYGLSNQEYRPAIASLILILPVSPSVPFQMSGARTFDKIKLSYHVRHVYVKVQFRLDFLTLFMIEVCRELTRNLFPPDDPWISYLCKLYIDIWFIFYLFYLYWLMGKGMAYGGLPFPGTGCPVPDVANTYLIWNVWCMVYCFLQLSTSLRCPRPWTMFTKKQIGLVSMDLLLYHIYLLYSG